MKWRIIEPWRGAYRVQRKGGLRWVSAVNFVSPYGSTPLTFNNEAAAKAAMEEAILDWQHKGRVVLQLETPDSKASHPSQPSLREGAVAPSHTKSSDHILGETGRAEVER